MAVARIGAQARSTQAGSSTGMPIFCADLVCGLETDAVNVLGQPVRITADFLDGVLATLRLA